MVVIIIIIMIVEQKLLANKMVHFFAKNSNVISRIEIYKSTPNNNVVIIHCKRKLLCFATSNQQTLSIFDSQASCLFVTSTLQSNTCNLQLENNISILHLMLLEIDPNCSIWSQLRNNNPETWVQFNTTKMAVTLQFAFAQIQL